MEIGINAFIKSVGPICERIEKNPTKETLTELRTIIINSPTCFIQRFHERIAFPLCLHLDNKKSTSDTIKQELLDSLNCLIQRIKINKLEIFLTLCTVVPKQVFDKQTVTIRPPGIDEELKLSTILCLNSLYHHISNDILIDLYTNSYRTHFPSCIFLCTQIAKTEKMRNLRISAINCLMTITYVHDEADFTDVVLRKQVADFMMSFLPGIVIALHEIALDDVKQGHKVTSAAIKALNRITVLHLEDNENEDEKENIFECPAQKVEEKVHKNDKVNDMKKIIEKLQHETRTSDWFKKTTQHYHKVIENLKPLQSHYHEIVRYELSDFCEQILSKCSRNLMSSLPQCVQILISLSEDDNSKVAQKSTNALKLIRRHYSDAAFIDTLGDEFLNVINSLPRIFNGTDNQKQLTSLNLLVGYLRLLGSENIFYILKSSDRLNLVLQCLIFISTLEKSNITIFEEYALRDFESISGTAVTWKNFKYIEEKTLFHKFQTALNLLSQSDAIEIIADSLIEIFSNDYEHKNEVIFLLNEIISVRVESSKNTVRLVNNILKMYIDEENWYQSTDTTECSLKEIHNNIVQMCLLVEGIGNMSHALGINFKTYLLKVLYIVLERAGSAQPLMSAAGLLTLLKISQNCGYSSVTDLIVQNTDYFSFHVINRLKNLEKNVAVLDVLNVVMKYSTIDVLPSILYVVNEVLVNSCDNYQEQNIIYFLRVFHSFIQSLRRWRDLTVERDSTIIKLLKEYKRNMDALYELHELNKNLSDDILNKSAKESFEEDMAKSKEELENENTTDSDYKKLELPEDIKLTVAVLKRSLNFLPSKNSERKILTLNILKDGMEIIKDWEDELLPLVHLIWSPLIDRFKESDNPLIINRSFELLTVLAKLSRDFIRRRTSTDVLPEICKTIKTLAIKSYLKDRGSAYRYNQEYKLQLIILNNFAHLVIDLEMSYQDINLIMKSTLPYLSIKQPMPLQESVISCYKTLACFDFDSVWFNLLEVREAQSKIEADQIEYCKNTEIVLKHLEVIHW